MLLQSNLLFKVLGSMLKIIFIIFFTKILKVLKNLLSKKCKFQKLKTLMEKLNLSWMVLRKEKKLIILFYIVFNFD